MYLTRNAATFRKFPESSFLRASSRISRPGIRCRPDSTSLFFVQRHLLPTCVVWWLVAATASPKRVACLDRFTAGYITEETTEITVNGIENAGMAQQVDHKKDSLVALKFEVYGKVQGVYFRAYTKEKAMSLGLVGYCLNTPHGTVRGEVEGPAPDVKTMLDWLKTTGSPQSVITNCRVLEMRHISQCSFTSFSIRR